MRRHLSIVVCLLLTASPSQAWAGMPSIGFSDIATLRLSGISFFLVVLLMSAWAIQGLWNWLGRDFLHLPRLNYWRACGLVTLWGLLFVVVLTMISGARELMTPGAWVRQGATHRLKDQQPLDATPAANVEKDSSAQEFALRRLRLAELHHQLQEYAHRHEGAFPGSPTTSDIAVDYWKTADISGIQYVYVPGRTLDDVGLPLVIEPELDAGDPLVLLVGGEIVQLPRERIAASVTKAALQP